MSTENQVAEHYGKGQLEEKILQAMQRLGKDGDSLTPVDLAAMDEFHVGGVLSTRELAAQMELQPGMRLLDVGSGVGGPARFFAAQYGCRVTGIDLTDEFVRVAKSLTKTLKLDQSADFQQGSALALPFEAAMFDRAYMIHVGMNISDKAGVFREVRRVLQPGGLFMIFDVMRAAGGKLRYPLPWAASEETSFVVDPATYRRALEEAGFRVEAERSRRAFAVEATERAMQDMAKNGPPVLGLQLLMGEKTPLMIGNILAMMKDGLLEPVELLARV
jgi:ubiquinone/menaquinone biosynthesis C-methylase UbiE